jgi:hypothetical protein
MATDFCESYNVASVKVVEDQCHARRGDSPIVLELVFRRRSSEACSWLILGRQRGFGRES